MSVHKSKDTDLFAITRLFESLQQWYDIINSVSPVHSHILSHRLSSFVFTCFPTSILISPSSSFFLPYSWAWLLAQRPHMKHRWAVSFVFEDCDGPTAWPSRAALFSSCRSVGGSLEQLVAPERCEGPKAQEGCFPRLCSLNKWRPLFAQYCWHYLLFYLFCSLFYIFLYTYLSIGLIYSINLNFVFFLFLLLIAYNKKDKKRHKKT